MSYIDLFALTCIGQMTDRRFSSIKNGAPFPDHVPIDPALRALKAAIR